MVEMMGYYLAVHLAVTKAATMVYVLLELKLVATMADYLVATMDAMMVYLMVAMMAEMKA